MSPFATPRSVAACESAGRSRATEAELAAAAVMAAWVSAGMSRATELELAAPAVDARLRVARHVADDRARATGSGQRGRLRVGGHVAGDRGGAAGAGHGCLPAGNQPACRGRWSAPGHPRRSPAGCPTACRAPSPARMCRRAGRRSEAAKPKPPPRRRLPLRPPWRTRPASRACRAPRRRGRAGRRGAFAVDAQPHPVAVGLLEQALEIGDVEGQGDRLVCRRRVALDPASLDVEQQVDWLPVCTIQGILNVAAKHVHRQALAGLTLPLQHERDVRFLHVSSLLIGSREWSTSRVSRRARHPKSSLIRGNHYNFAPIVRGRGRSGPAAQA